MTYGPSEVSIVDQNLALGIATANGWENHTISSPPKSHKFDKMKIDNKKIEQNGDQKGSFSDLSAHESAFRPSLIRGTENNDSVGMEVNV